MTNMQVLIVYKVRLFLIFTDVQWVKSARAKSKHFLPTANLLKLKLNSLYIIKCNSCVLRQIMMSPTQRGITRIDK